MKKFSIAAVGAIVVIAAIAAGYSGSARSAGSGVTPLPSSSCGPVVYKGPGSAQYIIASDLPLQGAIRHQTLQISRAILWELQQKGWKAGALNIGYQSCDDSTAQSAGWDSGKCATNARLYASNRSVIGVVGTFNSGCAKIEVPILNRAHPGPLAMVSPANTNPGLTKHWDPGEPQKYYPTGVRNYARVVATDDFQGPADAMWSQSLGYKKVYVLNDKQTYGFGVATTYKNAAVKLGIKVVGFKGWDAKQASYESLANLIKASGAQAVFLGGIVCNNGVKVLNDSFFNEFTVILPTDAREVVRELAEQKVLAGVSLGRLYPGEDALAGGLLVAVTETCSEADIDTLYFALKEVLA